MALEEDPVTNRKMLIAVTSEGPDIDSLVAEKFGKAPFILMYDADKNGFESCRNPYADIYGGAGIQTSQFIIEKNAGLVITGEIGLNSFRLLQTADIRVFLCGRKAVVEVIREYLNGRLKECKQSTKLNFARHRHRGKGRWGNKNL